MTKKTTKRPKKGAWFVPVRGSYLPCSWQGWLSYVPFIALVLIGLVPFANAIQFNLTYPQVNNFENLVWAFLMAFPYEVALVAAMTWLARRKS